MAPRLLNPRRAMSALSQVSQLRGLLAKCERGAGLDWDEIEALRDLEQRFAPAADDQRAREGRAHLRLAVDLPAMVRSPRLADRVRIHEVSPGGMLLTGVPYVDDGDLLEIVADDDANQRSYRFKAKVVWVRDDQSEADAYRVGVALLGVPVLIHYGPPSAQVEHDAVRAIAAAA